MGILYAILAAVTWALGDFTIEKTSRKAGSINALFFITLFAAIFFIPFAWHGFGGLGSKQALTYLLLTSVILFVGSLLDFAALRDGKISVIEPICAFEVPVTAILATLILHEKLLLIQIFLIVGAVIGIFLVSTKDFSIFKRIHAEKGARYALGAAVFMGGANFLFGEASRLSTPFFVNWFSAAFIATILLVYILWKRRLKASLGYIGKYPKTVGSMMVFDNFSWVFYAYAVLYMPIAVAIAISESYIVIASLLGLFFNKEKLRIHQFVGMIICAVAVIALSLTLK